MTGRFATSNREDDLSPYVERVLEVLELHTTVHEGSTLREHLDARGFDKKQYFLRPGFVRGWRSVSADPTARLNNASKLKEWSTKLGFPLSSEDTFVSVARKLRSLTRT